MKPPGGTHTPPSFTFEKTWVLDFGAKNQNIGAKFQIFGANTPHIKKKLKLQLFIKNKVEGQASSFCSKFVVE